MNQRLLDTLRTHPDGVERVRLLSVLNDRPRSDYELASALDLDYRTVQRHLSALLEGNLVQTNSKLYGNIYLLSDHARHEWRAIETINPLIGFAEREDMRY